MMEVGPPHTRLSGVGEQTTSSCVGVKAWVVSVEEKAESNPSGVFYEDECKRTFDEAPKSLSSLSKPRPGGCLGINSEVT